MQFLWSPIFFHLYKLQDINFHNIINIVIIHNTNGSEEKKIMHKMYINFICKGKPRKTSNQQIKIRVQVIRKK